MPIGYPVPLYLSLLTVGLTIATVLLLGFILRSQKRGISQRTRTILYVTYVIVLCGLMTTMVLVMLDVNTKCNCNGMDCGSTNNCGRVCGCDNNAVCRQGACVTNLVFALGRGDSHVDNILVSADGGENFSSANIPDVDQYDPTDESLGLFSMDFDPTKNVMVAVGTILTSDAAATTKTYAAWVIKSTDGGNSWQVLDLPANFTKALTVVFYPFTPDGTGRWFIGGQGTATTTTTTTTTTKTTTANSTTKAPAKRPPKNKERYNDDSTYSGIMSSDDDGQTWTFVDLSGTQPSMTLCTNLSLDSTTQQLYAVGSSTSSSSSKFLLYTIDSDTWVKYTDTKSGDGYSLTAVSSVHSVPSLSDIYLIGTVNNVPSVIFADATFLTPPPKPSPSDPPPPPTWNPTSTTLTTISDLEYGVTATTGMMVMIGGKDVATSSDGVTFTTMDSSSSTNVNFFTKTSESICFNEHFGRWIAVGSGGCTIKYSVNAQTWTDLDVSFSQSGHFVRTYTLIPPSQ